MGAPVVGISMYREHADWGSWHRVQADILPAAYAAAVTAGGGIPVLLPVNSDTDQIRAVMQRIDALVIAGGADVAPARYRAEPGPHTAGWRADRDATELALLDAAAERSIPTLGVCRGMQMMAVHANGALLQHVPDIVGHEQHLPGVGRYGTVTVRTEPGTRVRAMLGEITDVHCHHHQAVGRHPGTIAAAYADDGVLEAIEDPDRPFWIGVQWHPEVRGDVRLFAALVSAAHTPQPAVGSTR